MITSKSGIAIAVAMAGLLSTQAFAEPQQQPAQDENVRCEGINACKGQSACATAQSACAGLNGCKGQGWVFVETEKECKKKGGKVLEPPKSEK